MRTNWTENDIPDQTGRIAIVTGANSGIGWNTAAALARKGATVIMACRNPQKANHAAERIRALDPAGSVVVMQLDLADLDTVRAFAAEFHKSYDRLDLLINNAGVAEVPYGKTAQGVELHFGINYVGHFALTALSIDLLNATERARIVTVSSLGHRIGSIDFDDLNWERHYPAQLPYSRSKLANLLFTYELQRRLAAAGQGTLAVAAHPGWADTGMTNSTYLRHLNRLFAQTAEMGALPSLFAATALNVCGGDYLGPGGLFEFRGYPKKVKSSARSRDEALARRLWKVAEDLAQVRFRLVDGGA
jgi:NAD(P)-dependent dehydrogenase (short-subunit alcohol dehydrogenase family)